MSEGCCIVVIGHVDHGKTALVRALTGMDTDRLAEEKARGLSIVPGYAHRRYPSGTVDFIDAPGHADFVQAMVAGASGARAALLVVSAVEGIAAQTREHLSIAALLGISEGIVAITKSDLLEPGAHPARLADIRAALADTPLARAPMVMVSAQSGAGLAELQGALEQVMTLPAKPNGPTQSYLPIDRVFSLSGQGTVVTGTLLGPAMRLADELTLYPQGTRVRLRRLQSRGEARACVDGGTRVAANLRGVAVEELARGAVLAQGDSLAASTCMDVHISLLQVPRPLRHMQEVRVLWGSAAAVATVRLFGRGPLAPGAAGFAQLRFRRPVTGFPGQRAVLRRLSPVETLGGAVLLDPQGAPTGRGDPHRPAILAAALQGDVIQIAKALCHAQGGAVHTRDIERLARIAEKDVQAALEDRFDNIGPGVMASTDAVADCKRAILDTIRRFHAAHPLRTSMPRGDLAALGFAPELTGHALAALVQENALREAGPGLAAVGHDPRGSLDAQQLARLASIEAHFAQARLSSPDPAQVLSGAEDAELFNLLTDTGCLVPLRNVALKQTLVFHAEALDGACALLRDTFVPPQVFTTSQARAALSTSRRIIVPVLEYFDACGWSQRKGDVRRMLPTNVVSRGHGG